MNRIHPLFALVVALVSPVSAQSPPSAAQKADVAARIASAELDTATSRPSDAAFPASRKFNHNHKISSSFDRFKNETSVLAEVIPGGLLSFNTFDVAAVFGFQGKELSIPPRYVLLGFIPRAYPGDWQYLNDHSVNFLVDGTVPIEAGETLWDGDVTNDGHMAKTQEHITALLPVDKFLQLANGKKVEVRVGKRAITFKDDQLEVLRDLASRMAPTKRAP